MKQLKIAFGVITRNINSITPFINFLNNAQTYGHNISSIMLIYKDIINNETIRELNKYCPVDAIKLGKSAYLQKKLKGFNLSNEEIQSLICTPCIEKYNMVSYGTCRNYTLLTAILKGVDILIFFDTDVYPQILYEEGDAQFHYEEIDFVGSHLKILSNNSDVVATTSDYTGYYIIPKMNFPHLDDLLFGLQKETSLQCITHGENLVLKHNHKKHIHQTQKILGGNLAIDLSKLHLLTPFFSTTLVHNGECFLGRGEDTLFGPLITKYGGKCIDIDLPIFHNCFGDFPLEPEIMKKKNLDRFFYACTGWLIRNPFYNWLHSEFIQDFPIVDIEKRYKSLEIGCKAAAKNFDDSRFYQLPDFFRKSYNQLAKTKEEFFSLINAWEKLRSHY